MKVKDLIKRLKEMPQDLDVLWADHDEFETNNLAGYVQLIDKNDCTYKLEDCFKNTPDIYVVIRP